MRGLGAILEILSASQPTGSVYVTRPAGRHLPLQPDDKVHLGLSLNVEVARLPRLPLEPDVLLLGLEVLLRVLVRSLEDDLALGLGILAVSAMVAQVECQGRGGREESSAPKDG